MGTSALTLVEPLEQSASTRVRPRYSYLIAVLLCLQMCFCWAARGAAMQGHTDLRAFYGAGVLVRQGDAAQIYSDASEEVSQQLIFKDHSRTLHFLYPAFAALLFEPLAYFSYSAALMFVWMCDLGCIVTTAYLLSEESPRRLWATLQTTAIFLCCFPSAIALMQGQITFLLLLIYTSFHVLEKRGFYLAAGLVLSLGLIKFQFVLPVLVLYLCWRKYKVVIGFLLGALPLGVVSMSLTGVRGLQSYAIRMHQLSNATLLHPAAAHLQYGIRTGIEPNLHGLLLLFVGSTTHTVWLTIALSIVTMVWCARRRPSLVVALPAGLLLSYHMQPYDLVLLCLPLCLVWQRQRSPQNTVKVGEKVCFWMAMLLLVSPVSPLLFASSYAAGLCFASVFSLLSFTSGRDPERANL